MLDDVMYTEGGHVSEQGGAEPHQTIGRVGDKSLLQNSWYVLNI